MRNAAEAAEVARLRDLVERGLGASPWKVDAMGADANGDIVVRLKPKAMDLNQTAKSIVDRATRDD
jgi:hypothetical protein